MIRKIFLSRTDSERVQKAPRKRSRGVGTTWTNSKQTPTICTNNQRSFEIRLIETTQIHITISNLLQRRIARITRKRRETLSTHPHPIPSLIRQNSEINE